MNNSGKLNPGKAKLRRINTGRFEQIPVQEPAMEEVGQPEVSEQTVTTVNKTPEVPVRDAEPSRILQAEEGGRFDNNNDESLEDDKKKDNNENEQPIQSDVSDIEKAALLLSQLSNTPEEELLKTKLGLMYLGNRYKFTYCDDFSLEINQLIAELSMMPKKRKRLTREEKAKEIPIPHVEKFPNVAIPKEYKKVLDKIIKHSNAPLSVLLRMILAEWFERNGLSIEDEE